MKLRLKVFSLIFALFVAVFATSAVFAWFSGQYWDLDIAGGSVGAYFAYGDGTEHKMTSGDNPEIWDGTNGTWDMSTGPFGINLPVHMFNLAWLQNTGRFDNEKFYFELAGNVDMWDDNVKNTVLPPIGNNSSPFNGDFEGNGYTISNLIISTNKKVLSGNQSLDTYVFSNAVGLFGMTTEDSRIANFILENPTVEVAEDKVNNASTLYGTLAEDNPKVVGLAVGYVAGKVHSIGVLGGALAVRRENYTTVNSILGMLSETAEGDNNLTGSGAGGSAGGGSGNTFGDNFDVEGVWTRMKLIYGNGGQSFKLPNVNYNEKDDAYSLALIEKMPFTVTTASTYDGPDAKEITSPNNIGYMLGNLNETISRTVTFGEKLVLQNNGLFTAPGGGSLPDGNIPKWFYKAVASWAGYQTGSMVEMTQAEFDELPQDIKDIVLNPATNEKGEYVIDSIRLGGLTKADTIQIYSRNNTVKDVPDTRQEGVWAPHGLIEWGGGIYGEAYERDSYAADENGAFFDGNKVSGIWQATGNLLDEVGTYYYIFKYNDDGTKNYAAAINNKDVIIEADGRVKQGSWATWYYSDGKGNDFNAFGDYIFDPTTNTFTHPDGSPVYLYDAWNNPSVAVPVEGTRIPIDEFENGIVLPNCGMWFRPAKVGKIRLVMYSDRPDGNGGVTLTKVQRTAATADNPFEVNWNNAGYGQDGGIKVISRSLYNLNQNILYYFEFDVTEADLAAGYEYWMCQSREVDYGAQFVYMDIGASASVDDGDDFNPDADITKQVTAVDFIYKGVSIAKEDIDLGDGNIISKGSFIKNNQRYVDTQTMLSFGGSGAIVAFYFRTEEQDEDPTIYAIYKASNNELISKNTFKPNLANIAGTAGDIDVDGSRPNYAWGGP